MSRRVNFGANETAEPDSPGGGDERSPTQGLGLPELPIGESAGKSWVPARLELRLRCERADADGTKECVWMLQEDTTRADFSFESLYLKGSKSDEKTPVVRQYAAHGNFWCVLQRNDRLALGAKGTRSDGWVMVTSATASDSASAGKSQAHSRYVASLPVPDDFPGAQCEMVAQIRMRTRPFYSSTSICEGLSPELLQFCAPRKDEDPFDANEENDFITLTQRFPLASLAVDATKTSVTLHLFNGRLSVRMQRAAVNSDRWLVQAFRIIASVVSSAAIRKRPASSGSASGSVSARSAPRTPSGSGAAVVVAKEVVGAGVYGMGVPGWKGKIHRAFRKTTRLRVCKLLELVAGIHRCTARSVNRSAKSLHTTGMFLLDSVDTVFLWLGTNTGKKQNLKAQEFTKKYCKLPFFDSKGKTVLRAPYFKVSILQGGSETAEFWFYIGGFGEISRSGTMGEAALKAELPSPRAAQGDLEVRNIKPRVAVIGGGVAGCAAANFLQRNNVQCYLFERGNDVGGKLSPVPTKFFTFSGASAPMFCAKSQTFTQLVEQLVLDGALMQWAPRISVITDDGILRSVPEGGGKSSDFVMCSMCNATMSKSAVGSTALMRLGCCFNIACSACFGTLWGIKPTAEIIIRTVETLASQKRVLMCPVCDRRLIQIEQLVFDSKDEDTKEESDQRQELGLIEHWAPNLACAANNGFGSQCKWFIGKGGMMKFCESLTRKINVVTETEIVRLERKAGSHLYTLFKRVRADVSMRGAGKMDSTVLTKPAELACGSFDAVLCCLPARAAIALMQDVLPNVVARASAVSYKPRWVLLLQFTLVLPVSIDVAFAEPVGSNCPLDYICRESCRGSGNAQHKNGGDATTALVPLKVCGSRDSVSANLDLWAAHASCDWSAKNMHLPPAQAVKELTQVFLKILGMQQYSPSNAHAVLWDEAVMAPLPRQKVGARERRAFAMFNGSPHCLWDPVKRLGVAGEWMVEASVEGAFTSGVALARCSLNILTQPNIKDTYLNSQNENEDRQKEIALEAKIEKRRNLAAEKAMAEAERLEKVLNSWFGREIKKCFSLWRGYVSWRNGGKAAHIANVNTWRRQRDMKNTFKALRQICVKLRLQRNLAQLEPD